MQGQRDTSGLGMKRGCVAHFFQGDEEEEEEDWWLQFCKVFQAYFK